jgi:uncharacterized protein (DUF1015 family)
MIKVRHKIWRIDNRLKLQQFKEVLDPIDSFYIADGHHRIGSVAEYAKKQRDKYKDLTVRNIIILFTASLFPTNPSRSTITIVFSKILTGCPMKTS